MSDNQLRLSDGLLASEVPILGQHPGHFRIAGHPEVILLLLGMAQQRRDLRRLDSGQIFVLANPSTAKIAADRHHYQHLLR